VLRIRDGVTLLQPFDPVRQTSLARGVFRAYFTTYHVLYAYSTSYAAQNGVLSIPDMKAYKINCIKHSAHTSNTVDSSVQVTPEQNQPRTYPTPEISCNHQAEFNKLQTRCAVKAKKPPEYTGPLK